jgi:hypothetical protein
MRLSVFSEIARRILIKYVPSEPTLTIMEQA